MREHKTIHIQYLSQGTVETGGYRHEQKLGMLLTVFLSRSGSDSRFSSLRLSGHFDSMIGYTRLLFWFFKHAKAPVNIVPLRGGLPSILRNLFTSNKTIIVLHSHVQPYSSVWLKGLYRIMLMFFKWFRPKRAVIVTVAHCWKQEFEQAGVPSNSVIVVPNLFQTNSYTPYQTSVKKKSIHLGMNEPKTDKRLFELAERLNRKGFNCYFSTIDPTRVVSDKGVEVICFEHFEAYLKAMAESLYTIQFPSIEEGWSRIGHESVLVGTPLIGRAVGGLAELLEESGSMKADSIDEIENIITNGLVKEVNPDFVMKYDELNAGQWFLPLVNFCRAYKSTVKVNLH